MSQPNKLISKSPAALLALIIFLFPQVPSSAACPTGTGDRATSGEVCESGLHSRIGAASESSEVIEDNPWTDNEVISPEALAHSLSSNAKPTIVQVGFQPLFKLSHIPGAIYAGPANNSDGIDKLKASVGGLPRNKVLVIYCGCCPFTDCPNVRPAFIALKAMGFTQLKVLMLHDNFNHDWVNKGYPTDKPGGR